MGMPDWSPRLPARVFWPCQQTSGVSEATPDCLPEVRAAAEHGFELAPDAPMWCFLPAVWPHDDRAWVRDRATRYAKVVCGGEPARWEPWTPEDSAVVEQDTNELLKECGLGPRPSGRLWLLRPPPGFPTLLSVLEFLVDGARDTGLPIMASAPFIMHVSTELDRLAAPAA